ncbi:MAG: phosphotransferase [Anaerolineae bacterium]|nr:phosphotransferase [Anaerolineae bacterium]
MLRESAESVDLHALPDPLQNLHARLNESVAGTQSTIHGDLNLENGLVGPGGLIWLIDFAETRDGHALYDFAHLEAEILAHVIAPRVATTSEFVRVLQSEANPLLNQMHQIAAKCLFNPSAMREYWLALYATCLGATKYANMNAHQRQCLYLAAAYVSQKL